MERQHRKVSPRESNADPLEFLAKIMEHIDRHDESDCYAIPVWWIKKVNSLLRSSSG